MKKNSFWSSCPRKLESFPSDACFLGRGKSPSCDWFINSAEDNYCFWTWLRKQSDAEGGLQPQTLSKIAELLNIPQGRVSEIVQEAEANFKQLEELKEFL